MYLSSFSKILAPGLRTAFVIGPEELLAKIEIAKQSANLCGSSLDQRIILACLKRRPHRGAEGAHPPVLPREARRDARGPRATEMPAGVSWTRPLGGLFVWLSLPEGLDAESLLEAAVAEGVAYVTGAPFYVDGGGENTMRLTFAKEGAANITEGVQRLARVVRRRLGRVDRLRRGTVLDAQAVQHPVDHHARHGHVGPEGQRDAGQPAVPVEAPAQRGHQRHRHQGHDHHRQHRVREEDREVDRPHRPLAAEAHRSDLGVVDEVARQEQGGGGEGGQHDALVGVAAARGG